MAQTHIINITQYQNYHNDNSQVIVHRFIIIIQLFNWHWYKKCEKPFRKKTLVTHRVWHVLQIFIFAREKYPHDSHIDDLQLKHIEQHILHLYIPHMHLS
jgi:hypothetical protein